MSETRVSVNVINEYPDFDDETEGFPSVETSLEHIANENAIPHYDVIAFTDHGIQPSRARPSEQERIVQENSVEPLNYQNMPRDMRRPRFLEPEVVERRSISTEITWNESRLIRPPRVHHRTELGQRRRVFPQQEINIFQDYPVLVSLNDQIQIPTTPPPPPPPTTVSRSRRQHRRRLYNGASSDIQCWRQLAHLHRQNILYQQHRHSGDPWMLPNWYMQDLEASRGRITDVMNMIRLYRMGHQDDETLRAMRMHFMGTV